MFSRNREGNPQVYTPASIIQRIFKFKSAAIHTDPSFVGAVTITPEDGKEIDPTSGLIIGTAGTLHVIMVDGSEFTFPAAALPANQIHRLAVREVLATGTTATDIIGLY